MTIEPCATQLTICTDDPGATEAEYKAKGWHTGSLYVLRFYPSMQENLADPKQYALSFWRPLAERQPNLL